MSDIREKRPIDKFNMTMNIMIVAFVVILVVSVAILIYRINIYRIGKSTYTKLADKYAKEVESSEDQVEKASKNNKADNSMKDPKVFLSKAPIQVDFDGLLRLNKDVQGWLYQPKTGINYPVMKTDDNNYYLHHMIDGKYNYSGTLFIHCNNKADFEDYNTVIYGHNMKNGTMFGTIDNYDDENYYRAHPVFYYLTPEKNYRLDVYSGYVAPKKSDSYQIDFKSDKEYEIFKRTLYDRSAFNSYIELEEVDKSVTLSTCAYDFKDARFVVHANLVEID
ncbi:MAG: class B sortase [Lachnospiraceae bacterium]|nr:class B sortase [Lachnospiraceae bacterium]